MAEPVFYEVVKTTQPSASPPFAVVAIYPERRRENGCEAIVMSVHGDEIEAEASRAKLKGELQ